MKETNYKTGTNTIEEKETVVHAEEYTLNDYEHNLERVNTTIAKLEQEKADYEAKIAEAKKQGIKRV